MAKPGKPKISLQGTFFRVGETSCAGHVFDQADLSRRLVVELLIDGVPVALVRANTFVRELVVKGIGDGCFGFSFALPDTILATGCVAEARLANDGTSLGAPIVLPANVTG